MVAQVNKKQVAVIALAMDPTRQADRFISMAQAKFAAGMRAICVHGSLQGKIVIFI